MQIMSAWLTDRAMKTWMGTPLIQTIIHLECRRAVYRKREYFLWGLGIGHSLSAFAACLMSDSKWHKLEPCAVSHCYLPPFEYSNSCCWIINTSIPNVCTLDQHVSQWVNIPYSLWTHLNFRTTVHLMMPFTEANEPTNQRLPSISPNGFTNCMSI